MLVTGIGALPEEVILTLLFEVEGIFSAEPLGYVTSDIMDPDHITCSMLLIGWQGTS